MNKSYGDISGVILAGGRSNRMGFPKHFLKVEDKRIIDTTLELLKSLFDDILVVTDDKNKFAEFKDINVIEDLVKDCGPLAGIYTGLMASTKGMIFVAACDMPSLQTQLIRKLLDIAEREDFDCVMPYTYKGIEPLHAVYSKALLLQIEEALNKKELSIRQFLKHCNCKYVKAQADEASSFFNLNNPEDFKALHE